MKIRRRCKCGCGGVTNYSKIYMFMGIIGREQGR